MHFAKQSIQSSDCSVDMNNTSFWLIHIPHCEPDQIGSLSIDSVTVDRPGSTGDTGSLGIVYICLIVVCREMTLRLETAWRGTVTDLQIQNKICKTDTTIEERH